MKVWGQQENIGFSHFPACQRESSNCQLISKPVLMGRRKLATLFPFHFTAVDLLVQQSWAKFDRTLPAESQPTLPYSYCVKPAISLGPADQNSISIRLPALLGNSTWIHLAATLYQSSVTDQKPVPLTC